MWRTTLIFNTLFSFTERYLNIWAFHEGGSGNIGGACWEWVVHKRPNTPLLLSRFALPISNNATVKLSSLFRGVYFEYHFTPQLLTRFACPVLNQVREHVAWVLLYFVSLLLSFLYSRVCCSSSRKLRTLPTMQIHSSEELRSSQKVHTAVALLFQFPVLNKSRDCPESSAMLYLFSSTKSRKALF